MTRREFKPSSSGSTPPPPPLPTGYSKPRSADPSPVRPVHFSPQPSRKVYTQQHKPNLSQSTSALNQVEAPISEKYSKVPRSYYPAGVRQDASK